MGNLSTLALLIPGDNRAFNRNLHEDHEKRKAEALAKLREMMAPHTAPGENIDDRINYTGKDGSIENAPYTDALEQFVAHHVVSASVDSYHYFLKRLFEEALNQDRTRVVTWAKPLRLSKKRVAEIESTADLRSSIQKIFRGSESRFRILAHEFLGVPDLGLAPHAVTLRNFLVHELGEGESDEIRQAVASLSELGRIEFLDGKLFVSVSVAFEISSRMSSDVGIMDSILGRMLQLPMTDDPIELLSRCYS